MRVIPIFVAATAYWLLGALWYSALFGRTWRAGLEAQGVRVAGAARSRLATKLVLTFVGDIAASAALAMLLVNAAPVSAAHALELGLIAGLGVAATSLGVAYAWEGKRPSVFLVDAGYHVVGLALCALILAAWRA